MSSRFVESLAAGAVVVAVAATRFGATVADPDLWGHLRFGQDKIAAGGYIATDRYSFLTEGRTWFNHEWLAEIAMGSVFEAAGPEGLAVLKALLALGIVAFLFWWLLREGMNPIRAAIVMLFAVLAMIPTFGTFRPQLFTVLLFVFFLVLVRRASDTGSITVWLIPLMFAVWINVHGGVLAGLVILLAWAVPSVFEVDRPRKWRPAVALVGAFIATGFHPLGYSHIWSLLHTATSARPEIAEWGPVDLGSPVGLAYVALVVILVGSVLTSGRDIEFSLIVPVLALTTAPLIGVRHLQLFVPGLVLLGSSYLAPASNRFNSPRETSEPTAPALLIVGLTVVVVSSLVTFRSVASGSDCIALVPGQFEFPVRAVAALSEADIAGNAVVPFNWGEYVIWHLGPELQVSIDGRRETIYSKDALEANLDFVEGEGDWDRLLEWAPIDIILVPTNAPGAIRMGRTPAWTVAYQDELATIMTPAEFGTVLRGDTSLPVDGSGSCFPA